MCSIIQRDCIKDDKNCYDCLIYALFSAGARIEYGNPNNIYPDLVNKK